jgi:hypothetical protein
MTNMNDQDLDLPAEAESGAVDLPDSATPVDGGRFALPDTRF